MNRTVSEDGDDLTPKECAEFARVDAQFTDADYEALERALPLYASANAWPGDPLRQPARIVLEGFVF